ncbi:hypothetical protein Rleg2_2462 [Rhizobium leguminosarum bv. trifolii WSM2304]|uniref:Uncharacterized protein n=1 Tax=Rhizobium leguminosarum bv. trifolii (strain WSM2304) TaxID=395492 RepID=A0ABF7QP12_RHILW|nr:hypothetical protein [Rhizobium leguminosarum]ACI55736.1 hypothetical protein Rleg2_2462 [Rhizobium leguminosarum bv. trifolii WSM2304]
MRDLSAICRIQEDAAAEYAAGKERRQGRHAVAVRDYIAFNDRCGAKLAAVARKAMNINDHDQLYA